MVTITAYHQTHLPVISAEPIQSQLDMDSRIFFSLISDDVVAQTGSSSTKAKILHASKYFATFFIYIPPTKLLVLGNT